MVARRPDRTVEDEHARQFAETTDNDNRAPDPPPPEDDAPLGWERLIPGRRVFRLSSNHPDLPREWLAKYTEREYQRLAQRGDVALAIKTLRVLYASTVEPAIRAATTNAERFHQFALLNHALERQADTIPISDRATRRAFLAEYAYPEYLRRLAGPSPAIPFEVVVNDSDAPHEVELAPGEIMIRLADTPTRHLAREFLPFVTEAQQDILEHQPRGGRPADIAGATVVSLLREHTNLTAREITEATGSESTTAQAARKKVAGKQRRGDDQREAQEREFAQAWERQQREVDEFLRQRDNPAPKQDTNEKPTLDIHPSQ
ncbi:MAG: hypothetical protein M3Q71_04810 [Chloroflexota bacterium]|nr:hypothetical protein [Chloroflexota bacterium]